MHRFDVVIPTHAPRRPWLLEAVRSALASAGCSRVVVVDDGSPEPVPREWVGEDQRVTLVRQANAGPSAARNRGIKEVLAGAAHAQIPSPDWMVFLDDDDALLPDGPGKMIDLAHRLGALVCVAGRYEVLPDDTEHERQPPPEYAGGVLPNAGEVFRPVAVFGGSGMVVQTRVFVSHSDLTDRGAAPAPLRFDESLVIGEDRDMLRKIAERGPVAVCAAPALRVRIHAGSSNLTSPSRYERRIRDHVAIVGRWCDADSVVHFRQATRWLTGAAAKANVSDEAWGELTGLCHARGWAIPMKARLRRAASSLFGAARQAPASTLDDELSHALNARALGPAETRTP